MIRRIVGKLPDAVPPAIAAYALVGVCALLLGHFQPTVVLPLGGVVALAVGIWAWRMSTPRAEAGDRGFVDVLLVLFLIGWTGWNVLHAAQDIVVFRDPATYALAGEFLQHHSSLPVNLHTEVFGTDPGLRFTSAGFGAVGDPQGGLVYPQGSHLLPALLATGGWLAGDAVQLKVGVLIGAAALLALYGFGRRLAQPWAAALMVVALSLTLPMLHFSRETYSEPISLLCAFSGLTLLLLAHERERSWLDFTVAGVVLGAVTVARIDGIFALLAMVAYVTVVLALAPAGARRQRIGRMVAFVAPVGLGFLLAYLDLSRLAPGYWNDQQPQLQMIEQAVLALSLGGVVAVGIAWRTPLLDWLQRRTARWRAAAGAGVVLTGFAVLATRPLWLVAHDPSFQPQYRLYIAFLQRAGHHQVDETRTYAEHTLQWISWYLGPTAVVVGALGLAGLVYAALRRHRPQVLLFLLLLISTAGLYLTSPNITPDQVWASRRLLPVVIPGLLVCGAVAASWLWRRGRLERVVAVLASLAVVAFPAFNMHGLGNFREGVPQLDEVHQLCALLGRNSAVLLVGGLDNTYLETVHTYCDVPTAGLPKIGPDSLRTTRSAAAQAGRQLYVLAGKADAFPPDVHGAKRRPVVTAKIPHWNATIEGPPRRHGLDRRFLFLGRVTEDGDIEDVEVG